MKIEIDSEKALALLKRAVEERGADYVDPNAGGEIPCTYAYPDDSGVIHPSCIVGHALYYAGVRDETLRDVADVGDASELRGWFTEQYREGIIDEEVEITPSAATLFLVAQRKQDLGRTWGEALNDAQRHYDEGYDAT